ncbi:MAG: thioredoxin [Deltaproteobacteria bacterium CG2_30_63_29]|nr:MAG: thioredoxin [Deltaproteobacteria bacterium CG2_30_63_29]PJB35766.1 MAG: thioredoxin [Deltaproteobacteria bacterium CG_4_9_14_3_um_filter_63_12]
MATVELNKDNFETTVEANDILLVDFWASWCGPCMRFAPTYEAISEKHPNIVFAKVNTEEQPELASYFQIRSIPTLMVFREQTVLFAQPGALPGAALEDLLKQVEALDMAEIRKKIAEEQGKDEQENEATH